MSHVIAGRGVVLLTNPESVIQVLPLIQPQTVTPFTEGVFMNTGKCAWKFASCVASSPPMSYSVMYTGKPVLDAMVLILA
jgi:hypothetical protein